MRLPIQPARSGYGVSRQTIAAGMHECADRGFDGPHPRRPAARPELGRVADVIPGAVGHRGGNVLIFDWIQSVKRRSIGPALR